MDAGPEVSVLIVTYNGRDSVRTCLSSVLRAAEGVACEVLVRDNASADGTAELIRDEFPEIRLTTGDNVGFGRAVNALAEEAQGRWLLLVNPDTDLEAETISHLLAFGDEHPDAGLLGGRTFDPDGRLNPSSCWGFPSAWSLTCFATGLTTVFRRHPWFDPESLGRWERDSVRTVDIITGCLLLVTRDVWTELGGFDPRFWLYGEDADLCARAWQRGYRPTIVPQATMIHEIGVSSESHGAKVALVMKGKATFIRKHWRGPRRWYGLACLRAGVGLRALLGAVRHRRGGTWGVVWAGRRDWLPGYPPAGG